MTKSSKVPDDRCAPPHTMGQHPAPSEWLWGVRTWDSTPQQSALSCPLGDFHPPCPHPPQPHFWKPADVLLGYLKNCASFFFFLEASSCFTGIQKLYSFLERLADGSLGYFKIVPLS